MSSLLVRNMKPEILRRLKSRAAAHGRSLQAEVLAILEAEATLSDQAAWVEWSDAFRSRTGSQSGADSVDLVRESRDER